jgi:hypothetical protein
VYVIESMMNPRGTGIYEHADGSYYLRTRTKSARPALMKLISVAQAFRWFVKNNKGQDLDGGEAAQDRFNRRVSELLPAV